MNRIDRLISSQAASGRSVAAAVARGRGRAARRVCGSLRVVAWAGAALMSHCLPASAAPAGGVVTAGSAGVTQGGNTTTVTQTSPTMSMNWQSFNIGAQEKVSFVQPSAAAIAVNRIADINGTQVLGALNANGQVYLINPNGILFGPGAQVNVGGLVASTLDLNGGIGGATPSFSGNGGGSVINLGSITAAPGAYVALLGRHVSNQGVITARLGTVALGAGSAATLDFNGGSLVHVRVDQSVVNSLAENGGLIQADGGMVMLSAGAANSLLASAVNNTGVIEARTLENRNGVITLLGGMAAGAVSVGGVLDASAPEGGNGGTIETSAAVVNVAGNARIDTRAPQGATGVWHIDPADFTIAPAGGNMTGAALSTSLATSNMLIDTVGTTGSGAGDINVNDALNWSSGSANAGANTLTLNAAGSINLNAPVSWGVSGTPGNAATTGALVMNAGNAINIGAPVNAWWRAPLTMTAGPGGVNVDFDPEKEQFSGAMSFYADAGTHAAAGSGLLAINGHPYTVIADVTPRSGVGVPDDTSSTSLQGMQNNPAGYYALGSDIDATATGGWVGSVFTFKSIASFFGVFDGLGHIIHHLDNELPADRQGLFGINNGIVRNVGMADSLVSGQDNVGALAGINRGTISNSYSSSSVSGQQYVGALVGYNDGGVVIDSAGIGQVGGTDHVGGLVGLNMHGVIRNSYADGVVASFGDNAGGLVGTNNGTIIASHAAGSVQADGSDTGGLVGLNESGGSISASYATAQVNGAGDAGGLVGTNHGAIGNSYAAGSVLGADDIGGLVGYNDGAVTNSYAVGNVTDVGMDGGALLGSNHGGMLANNFYNADSHAGLTGIGSAGGAVADIAGKVWGMSSAAMQTQANFTSATGTAAATDHSGNGGVNPGWDVAANGSSVPGTWVMTDGVSAPLLTAQMKQLSVTAINAIKTYDGAAYGGGNGATYSATPDTNALAGVLTYGGTAQGAVNAGSYTIAPGGLYAAGQGGYLFKFVSGVLTIAPAPLTVTSTSIISKEYDGTTTASGGSYVVSGTLYTNSANGNTAADALSGGTYAFASPDPLGPGNSIVNVSGVTVSDGNGGHNYLLSYVGNKGNTIMPPGGTTRGGGTGDFGQPAPTPTPPGDTAPAVSGAFSGPLAFAGLASGSAASGDGTALHSVRDASAGVMASSGVTDDGQRAGGASRTSLHAGHIGWADESAFHSCSAPGHAESGSVTISLGADGSLLRILCAGQ